MEGEIATLRSVLSAKQRQAGELRERLGMTPIAEMKKDFEHGVQTIKESGMLVFSNGVFFLLLGFSNNSALLRIYANIKNSSNRH